MIYVFLADGFEETEALVPTDILRRGGFEVRIVGVTGKTVTGSHGIQVVCDITESQASEENLCCVVLPGGMPGTVNLEKSDTVRRFINFADENGLVIGAICAAPSILGHMGLLNGKKATCFPGFEKELTGAILTDAPAVCDGNTVTAWGAGGAFEFGLCLLKTLTDEKTAASLAENMKYPFFGTYMG